MRADIVVDLQFGSTGKGAVCAYLAKTEAYAVSVRVQSIQAGHTLYHKGTSYKMRTIPCAWVNPETMLVLGAGCFIDKDLLLEEVDMIKKATGEDVRERLFLDPRATYIVPQDVEDEKGLDEAIGSTAHGAGASLIRKLGRREAPTSVLDDDWAHKNGFQIVDTIWLLNKVDKVLIEGCQGTMLSVHTSPYYPFVTARECTAAGVMSEIGLSPRDVAAVFGVFRTFPIRVGGNSGPTGGTELSWADIDRRAGRQVAPERTTVTNRVRRIFEFDREDFVHAAQVNKPSAFFMTFADYLAPGIYGKTSWDSIEPASREKLESFINRVERILANAVPGCGKVDWVGTGEQEEHFLTR